MIFTTSSGKKIQFYGLLLSEDSSKNVYIINCICVRYTVLINGFSNWKKPEDEIFVHICKNNGCFNCACMDCHSTIENGDYKCPFECNTIAYSNNVENTIEISNPSASNEVNQSSFQKKSSSHTIQCKKKRQSKINQKKYQDESTTRQRKANVKQKIRRVLDYDPEEISCSFVEDELVCGETRKSFKEKHPHTKNPMKWIRDKVNLTKMYVFFFFIFIDLLMYSN
jgi:hypothetical protein